MNGEKIAVVLASLGPGGAERIMTRLAGLLARRGFSVELVVPAPQSEALKAEVPEEVSLVELEAGHYYESLRLFHRIFRTKNILLLPWAFVVFLWKLFASMRSLAGYIRRHKPRLLLTAHYNAITLVANFFAGSPAKVVVTEHTLLSEHLRRQPAPVRVCFSMMCRFFYPKADHVVGVSSAVAADLVAHFSVPASRAEFIYNPVVGSGLKAKRTKACPHPWLMDKTIPTLTAVARLSPEKDFETLLEAFSLLRRTLPARLIVLGDGPDRGRLEQRARALNIDGDVDWAGMVANPLPFMREADVLVLPTFYEGLPTVLIEALSAGTTPVATDAPGGIREILEDGRYGYIVPMQDAQALSEGMLEALRRPMQKEMLLERAEFFSEEKAVGAYLDLLHRMGLEGKSSVEAAETANAVPDVSRDGEGKK